jgi:hypothetical protein
MSEWLKDNWGWDLWAIAGLAMTVFVASFILHSKRRRSS